MKNQSLLIRLFAVVAAMMCALGANAAEAYANYTPSNTTLTFYYDNQRSSRSGKTYALNSSVNSPGWITDSTNANVTKAVFDPSFANARPTSTSKWFYHMEKLQSITGISYLNTSNVTKMFCMFTGCSGLTSLDLSGFDTQNVTNMQFMFEGCSGLTSLDLSDFNTQNVTTMSAMFFNCIGLTSLDLSDFNTQNVTTMSSMFYKCSSLITIYVGNSWSTENVTSSGEMFYKCSNLVGGQGTTYKESNPKDKTYAHIDGGQSNPGYFSALNSTANPEAYACYRSSSTTLTFYYDNQRSSRMGTTYLLNSETNFPGWITDGSNANVTKVVFNSSFAGAHPTSTCGWFSEMGNLQFIVGISYLNTGNVTNMRSMFNGCSGLTSLDLTSFDTQNVTEMSFMFNGCSGLTSLDLTDFNTQKVTSMSGMFYSCSSLNTVDVGISWSTERVTSSVDMFYKCYNLVGGQGTTYSDSNPMDKTYAHADCGPRDPGYFTGPTPAENPEAYACYTSSNTTLTFYYDKQRPLRPGTTYDLNSETNFPGWITDGFNANVTKVVFSSSFASARPTSTYGWFSEMGNLQSISLLTNLNTSWVTNMSYMFYGCSRLTSLDLSDFNTQNVTDMSRMFYSCSSLNTVYVGSRWSTESVTSSGYMFYKCYNLIGSQGTTYSDSNPMDKTYAHVDGGPSNPGYFRAPNSTDNPVAYACYTSLNTTLTFYYDKQRSSRPGTTYDLNSGFNSPGWITDSTNANVTKVVFDPSFANARPTSTCQWFYKMGNLQSITGLSYLNTGNVTNMRSMFLGCSSLTSLDLSGFDTQNVTNMHYMFHDCSGLTSLNLSGFNTQNVTDMSVMFSNCSGLTSLDLSDFNTQNVTTMGSMFYKCISLTTIYVRSIWSTENVTSSGDMFYKCYNLLGGQGTTYSDSNPMDKTYAHIDGGQSNPGYLTESNQLIDPSAPYAVLTEGGKTLQFRHDGQRPSMTSLKTYSLNPGNYTPGWIEDGSNAEITSVVFLEEFANARPESMHSWFEGMSNLTRIWYLDRLNTSEVTDMANLFNGCNKLSSDNLDISGFNTSKVADMSGMFEGCTQLTTLDVSHFDTRNVQSMASMFSGCTNLTSLNTSGLNTSMVTDMSYMFSGCLTPNIDVTSFDTRLVTDMSGMFYDCHVRRPDVSGFDTQNVTDMHDMFKRSSVEDLDLHSFNTATVTDMSGMFELCLNLGTITVGEGWTVAGVISSENMFHVCSSLTGEKGTRYQDSNPMDKTYAHIDGGESNPGYLTDINGPYAALSADGKTLTFYNDGHRLTRTETTYGLNAGYSNRPGWMTDGSNAAIEHVVFDASFADARPVSTDYWFSGMSNLSDITGMEYLNTSEVMIMSGMFSGCSSLTNIDLIHFNTSKVTNMPSIFKDCTGLTSLDLIVFDTQNVLNMRSMFDGCSNLTTIYAGAGWNTEKVDAESSEYMFRGCTSLVGGMGTVFDADHTDKEYARIDGGQAAPGYFSGAPAYAALSSDGTTLTFYCDMLRSTRGTTYDLNQPEDDPDWYNDGSFEDITTVVFDPSFASARPIATSSWFYEMEDLTTITGMEYLNTSKVTDMSYMFNTCLSLTSLDLSHFDTGKVTNMRGMFMACGQLTSLDLGRFNTANVTNMGYMFYNCYSLTSLAVGDLNTGNVEYMDKMFAGCTGLTEIDFSGFGFMTTNVTDMNNMFSGCSRLTSLNTWRAFAYGTQNVTDMSYMFRGCSGLTSLDLTYVNTESATNLSHMFDGCTNLTEITLNKYYFTTSNVTDMTSMFMGCSSLQSLDLSSFNTENLTTINRMFQNCSSLKQIDLSSFNTDKIKNSDMDWLFANCSSLERVDVSSFNTSGLTSLWSMFINCSSLKVLDLSSFDTKKVTLTTTMFQGCTNLKAIYVGGGWDMSTVTTSPGMFDGCTSIVGCMGTTYDANHIDKAYAHIDGGSGNPGYLSEKGAPYAALSSDGKTLTFYCDGKNTSHTETTFSLNEGDGEPAWYTSASTVTTVVFDESFAVAQPTSMFGWFATMTNLTTLTGLENLNTKSVTNMGLVLYGCSSLTTLDLSSFDTRSASSMGGMFWNCTSLQRLDLSSFNTENVTDMSSMFQDCSKLKTIYAPYDWNRSGYTMNMFSGCTSIVGGMGTTYDPDHINGEYARIDELPRAPGYFSTKPAFLRGDVNGDGNVTVADVTALIDYLLGGDASLINLGAADCNLDTTVTIADVTSLIDYLLSGSWPRPQFRV